MHALQQELGRRLAANHGVVAASQGPELRSSLRSMVRRGELVRAYPGVYLQAGRAADPATRVTAAAQWAGGRAVVTGHAAAALSYWPETRPSAVDLVLPDHVRSSRGDARVWRGSIPADHVMSAGQLLLTRPAWNAVWLARWDDGEAIERALRAGAMDVDQMARALADMKGLVGHDTRRTVVRNSRNAPWSAAERHLHRILRTAEIGGWQGNWRVRVAGTTWILDVAMPGIKFAIEVNGYEFHSSRQSFIRDHEKLAALQEAGWTVLWVTWAMLQDPVTLVRRIRRLMAMAARQAQ